MKRSKVLIDYKLCKKCGICSHFCPKQVFTFNELDGPQVDKEEDCIACEKCVMMCPEMAIEITNLREEQNNA